MRWLVRPLKRLAHAMGMDVRRLTPSSSTAYQLRMGLDRFNIDLVFDIGANVGQFASELRSVGYRGDIVSFEPLSGVHEALSSRAARDAKWRVHGRGAVGDCDGQVEINIAGNSVSSSLLPMLEAHSSAAANSTYVASESAPIFRLDTVGPAYIPSSSRYFIKIDAQGFEWQVLDGASEVLAGAQGVLCEVSLVPLYAGQHLWLSLIHRLEGEGFTLWSVQKGLTDPRDGRTLQLNAVFFRDTDRAGVQ